MLSKSYTSIFSIFELIKGINRSKDSLTRSRIFECIRDAELKYINLMPIEMFQAAFEQGIFIYESNLISEKINNLLHNIQSADTDYDEIVKRYESATRKFQDRITQTCSVPAPPPKIIRLNLEEIFSEPKNNTRPYLEKLPPNLPPAHVFMECLKHDEIPNFYRQMNPSKNLSNEEIIALYKGSLDIYLFANFTYHLKRKALREGAAKNDFLDIIHAVYLVNREDVIVSDDRIFDSILPKINKISVDEYKNLINLECSTEADAPTAS